MVLDDVVVVDVAVIVDVADVLMDVVVVVSAKELGMLVSMLLKVGGPGMKFIVGSDLSSPESLFIAPKMAITTPVMPAVQRMTIIHCHFENILYQGGSAGSTHTLSCIAGSLLPVVPG